MPAKDIPKGYKQVTGGIVQAVGAACAPTGKAE